mgnify:FL=1
MDFVKVTDDKNINDLLVAINQNLRTTNYMQKEMQKRNTSQSVFVSNFSDEEPLIEETMPFVPEQESNQFENDILYYMSELSSLKTDSSKEEIKEVLPNKNDYDYEKVLLRLMAELVRENNDMSILSAEEGVSLEEKEFLTFEIEENLRRKNILRELVTEKEKEEENEIHEENKLVFMPTQSGNPCVISELKHIDSEYYESFASLFESIITGKFKNLRKFSPNSATAGLFEVKDFAIRVILSRLGPREYCVISAFTKKTDSNKDYQEQINLRASNFRKLEASLKENIKNDEFMRLQETYQEELFNMLGRESKKGMQKEKKDDLNDTTRTN